MEKFDDIASRVLNMRRGGGDWEIDSSGVMTKRQPKDEQEHPVQPKGYACRLCKDWGIIPFDIIEGDEKYRSNARCRCSKGQEIPDRFPTWKELFGRWPDEPVCKQPIFGRETLVDGQWVSE